MSDANADQVSFWNADAAQTWIRLQPALDAAFADITALLLDTAAPVAGEVVLDIGCGAGATTLAVADRVGPTGRATGVDVSAPLLELARRRAAGRQGVDFLLADAQIHPFARGAHDLVVSRFGSMFFEDTVAAFANLRSALRPGGRMVLVAWADLEPNPWFKVLRDAAVAVLGQPAPASPTAPGALAFADVGRVEGLLRAAGLDSVQGREVPIELVMAGNAELVASRAAGLGPAARLMREKQATDEQAAEVIRRAAAGFEPYFRDGAVRLPALLTLFTAARS